MPNYYGQYGGSSLGSDINSATNDIAEALKRVSIRNQQQKAALSQVQGILDFAKTVTVTDPKTGKPKPLFTQDQTDLVQQALSKHDAYRAGALAASMGMGKGLLQRAAKADEIAQGPNTRVQNGVTFRQTATGWVPMNVPMRNAQGLTPNQQANQQAKQRAADQRQFAAQQAGLDAQLKAISGKSEALNRATLFDPSQQVAGYMADGKFQTVSQVADHFLKNNPAYSWFGSSTPPQPLKIIGQDGKPYFAQSTDDLGEPTHVQIGYKPSSVTPKGKIIDKGNPGVLLPATELAAYQDTAAAAVGPKAVDALQWTRQNPNDPLSDKALSKLHDLQRQVMQAGTRVVQPLPEGGSSGDTGEDNAQEPPPADTQDEGP